MKDKSFGNNSIVSLVDIGEEHSSLLCLTNKTDCCESNGEWYLPNSYQVQEIGEIYSDRGSNVVRLHRKSNAVMPIGVYRCEISGHNNIFIGVYPDEERLGEFKFCVYHYSYVYLYYIM